MPDLASKLVSPATTATFARGTTPDSEIRVLRCVLWELATLQTATADTAICGCARTTAPCRVRIAIAGDADDSAILRDVAGERISAGLLVVAITTAAAVEDVPPERAERHLLAAALGDHAELAMGGANDKPLGEAVGEVQASTPCPIGGRRSLHRETLLRWRLGPDRPLVTPPAR